MSATVEDDDYNCLRCGACCVSDFEDVVYVHLGVTDIVRLDQNKRDILVAASGPTTSAMRTSIDDCGNCRCIALSGIVGADVSCSIYESRPSVCRKFQPGSDACDFARRSILGISTK